VANHNAQQFTVYFDGETAAAVRREARRQSVSVSAFLKSVAIHKLYGQETADERTRSRILYLSVGMDAVLDELQVLRQPPPLTYRHPHETSLRKVVKQVHQARLAEQSDAD
jgi:hypothetical protein